MRLGEDVLEGHAFTTVAIEHAKGRFVMCMDDLGFGYIGDTQALGLRPLSPTEVLETGQRFVIRTRFP